ncbi:MAG: type II toxin-antitoxin system VapC family toxin [Candidatus Dojkabacteria bacterium]
MNNCLLDTDIIIDLLRGYPKAIEFFKGLDEINVTFITALELIDGCKNKREIGIINNLLKNVTIIDASAKSQIMALKFFEQFKLSKGIGLVDSIIAGIVYEQDFILVTRNTKHYEFISGLNIHQPY